MFALFSIFCCILCLRATILYFRQQIRAKTVPELTSEQHYFELHETAMREIGNNFNALQLIKSRIITLFDQWRQQGNHRGSEAAENVSVDNNQQEEPQDNDDRPSADDISEPDDVNPLMQENQHEAVDVSGNDAILPHQSFGPRRGGMGLGQGGVNRHRKILRDNIQGISKSAIRRLARRGGVQRINGLIYEEARGALKVFLESVIRDAFHYTENANRKTITNMDIEYALKRKGRTLYGFRK